MLAEAETGIKVIYSRDNLLVTWSKGKIKYSCDNEPEENLIINYFHRNSCSKTFGISLIMFDFLGPVKSHFTYTF